MRKRLFLPDPEGAGSGSAKVCGGSAEKQRRTAGSGLRAYGKNGRQKQRRITTEEGAKAPFLSDAKGVCRTKAHYIRAYKKGVML